MNPPYNDRIVAFIDILGFESLIKRLGDDGDLHSKLLWALRRIGHYKEIAGKPEYAQKELEVSVFSDSIVISSQPEHIFDVVWSCVGLQSQLLALAILTRGGISMGRTYHQKDILYGDGMIKAYRLESGAAIYPRIIVDPNLMPRVSRGQREMYLSEDHDGLWFVVPFAMGILPACSDDLLEDGWDPHHVALVELGKHIEREIAATNEANHQMKWRWLESQRRNALAYLEKNGSVRIFHRMKLAEQRRSTATPDRCA